MGYDVFISHSSQDKPIADAVCATLEANRIRCWIAPRDIMPGMEWSEAILNAIHTCRIMIIVFSSHANASQQVKREVERAVNRGVAIVPFRIEEVYPSGTMEYFMSTTHWLDALTTPMERHLEKLARTVDSLLDMDEKRTVPLNTGSDTADDNTGHDGLPGEPHGDVPGMAQITPPQAVAPSPATPSPPQWNPELLKMLERDLASHIGPLAKILVRKTAQTTGDVQTLCQELAKHIPVEAEQESFLEKSASTARTLAGSSPNDNNPAGPTGTAVVWDAQALESVEKRLARQIGPLAKVLVKKAAQEATNLTELCHRLAEHIPDEEKASFLEDSCGQPPNRPVSSTQPAPRRRWGHAR